MWCVVSCTGLPNPNLLSVCVPLSYMYNVYRSAPSSPTHHPLMASDFALREVEAKFALPHTPPSQFTLPPTLFPPSAIQSLHSSSSLPASPSRPHTGFAASPFKYFPLGVRSTSVEALAPEVARKRDLAHEGPLPPAKRTRSGDGEGGVEELRPDPQPVLKPLHPMSLTTIPGAASFTQPPSGVQFFQIPVNPSAAPSGVPMPAFLSQGFIGAGPPGVSSQPSGEQGNRTPNSHEEG